MKKLVSFFLLLFPLLPVFAQQTEIVGPVGTQRFGYKLETLPNGNYVVTDPYYDDGVIQDVGAVFLYNGQTHMLMSMVTGSSANDMIGLYEILVLKDNYFLICSINFDNGSIVDAGSVTLCNGNIGLNGKISAANSLVGTSTNDNVGDIYTITLLSNGNYVVSSRFWDNGSVLDAGAITFCSIANPVTGVISSANSLIGSHSGDLSSTQVKELKNNNFILLSPYWDNGDTLDVGAVTWCSGVNGIAGLINHSNSLTGVQKGDNVGLLVSILNNGNYVVLSPSWDNGTVIDAGAATWGNGNSGISGIVTVSNSIVGTTAGDWVGNGCTPLSNGNYILNSASWSNGLIKQVGAVTWCDGFNGTAGLISSSNSITGILKDDRVGSSIRELTDGNYVIISPYITLNGKAFVGAVTWCNGSQPLSGFVNPSNSMIGASSGDEIGYGGVLPLKNGNYVILSPFWDNGSTANAGAVTWCRGKSKIVDVVSISNSLVGDKDHETTGSRVYSLGENLYAVYSGYRDANASLIGAITWCNADSGRKGIVSAANSLIGRKDGDLNSISVYGLANGNFIFSFPSYDNGLALNAGAVIIINPSNPLLGSPDTTNSFMGATYNDQIGGCWTSSITIKNGNYVLTSIETDNGINRNAGSVTLIKGNGETVGTLNSYNSLVGGTINDQIGNSGATALDDGNFIVRSVTWNSRNVTKAGAITYIDANAGLTGLITPCTSVVGAKDNSGNGIRATYNSVYSYLLVSLPGDNKLVIYDPAKVVLANSSDQGDIVLYGDQPVLITSNGSCRYIATLWPQGNSRIDKAVRSKVWIENTVPLNNGLPFVSRHYEFATDTLAGNSTYILKLYFKQQEFNDFNSYPGAFIKLPSGPDDYQGKANLRIGYYKTVIDVNNVFDANFKETTVIDPLDKNIVWNELYKRWEVSFETSELGGFVAQTSGLPLDVIDENTNPVALSIFPNPSTDYLRLKVEYSKPASIKACISDVSGKIINSYQWKHFQYPSTYEIDIRRLPAGVYIIETIIDGKKQYNRFIKR